MKITLDDKILRQVSEPYNPEIHDIKDIVAKLKEATDTAWTPGFGLACIQIGMPIRVAWFKYQGEEEILINPEITYRKHKQCDIEGCLSMPYNEMPVVRSKIINYISDGKKKIAKGLKARIIQHEIDHMKGILITDKEANQ